MFNSNNGTLPVSIPIGVGNGGGFGNGNGFDDIIALAIIAMIFGWNGNGGIFGGGGNGGASAGYVLQNDFATIQRQLSDGFNSIDNALDRQNAGICDLGYTSLSLNNQTNMNMMQGFNGVQSQLADCCCKTQSGIESVKTADAFNTATITSAIKDCCCENEKIALQNRYESAQQHCETLRAISDSTKQIVDHMAAEKAAQLRDENFALKLASSQEHQNNVLINTLRPVPVPSFPVPSPFYYGNGGYGFYNGTTIA